ncbi:chloride channel accessory 1 gene 2 L homeolog precursor [Xenopus laevis]|uniref:Calcium activated chloride channel n=1 Tax=Xenopus laevis TaxID=8355 RepID=F7IYU5_XENLA|nr:chloride channel accessory 1 gene 2 L homeolog precursor [Xenopus laevis]BAK40918.1 calcium activated chloride channel [Xenopus laevis]
MTFSSLFALVLTFHVFFASSTSIKLQNGGYEDIVIAINPGLRENFKIIENIQNMIKDATPYLFSATRNRVYIRSVKILIPITWPNKNYTKARTETYDKADVIIASPHVKFGDDPYTLQYGGCGEPGKYIHMTPDFFLDDNLISIYGPRGRVFVHEWAHLRWGVFDEYNYEKPFYVTGTKNIEATRCSADIIGTYMKLCQGRICNCIRDPQTGLYEDGCVFVPERNQAAKSSIMYSQALPSVTEFCEKNHNTEAPTLQNRICNSRSTWDVIMNSTDIKSTPPKADSNLPVPTFSLLQSSDRVVTLVLDVSGSMTSGDRIGRLYQAAEVFVMQIVEEGSHVGIVTFSTTTAVLSKLVQVIDDTQRNKLKRLLPKTATGGTDICKGIREGIKLNKEHDGSSSNTELVLLTDGEDNYDTSLCFPDIKNSGAIIHFIALGPKPATKLEQIVEMTGGLRFLATDKVDALGLIDAFSSLKAGDGATSQHAIQLESSGSILKPKNCLTGTVFIDKTVGNGTFFLVTWVTLVPSITLIDPNGKVYTSKDFTSDTTSKSSRLKIPGTAERGAWQYNLCNNHTANQAIGILVTSMAADENVPPITVNAHMNRDNNNFPEPMIVYASVNQGLLPVVNANVTAIIEPVNGKSVPLELYDNGAGVDIVKNDGIYSGYFFEFQGNGRYSLKVRVENSKKKSRLALPRSRALYIPGYLENGQITMNPSRPVINDEDFYLGEFSRTASGGSFIVNNIPPGVQPDLYKPEKVTDLEAKIEGNTIVLTWTATGDDLDKGTVSGYDLRMNTNPSDLRNNFDNSTTVNTSSLMPQIAGSSESFTFVPNNIAIENGTILYFALTAFDKVAHKSDLSNIAQAALLIPPTPAPTTVQPLPASTTVQKTPAPTTVLPPSSDDSSGTLDITFLTMIVCSSVIIICIIISITVCIVNCRKKKRNPEIRP